MAGVWVLIWIPAKLAAINEHATLEVFDTEALIGEVEFKREQAKIKIFPVSSLDKDNKWLVDISSLDYLFDTDLEIWATSKDCNFCRDCRSKVKP
jgi:hypothetical protein